jgi:type VI secretion system Hcp family effector
MCPFINKEVETNPDSSLKRMINKYIIMKKQFKYLVLYFPLLITLSAFSGNSQNQFTHIASKENRSGNGDGTMLDIPQLNGNPKAIIFVTQKEQGLNPHPIGVYYFKGRWSIMNLDQAGIPAGSEFEVKYFIDPDKDHFQYLIKKENLRQKDGSAFIDHPALNNHPDAQFSVFHSWVPEAKEYGNRQEVQVQYDPGADKWVLSIVSNMVNKSLPVYSAYNINITSAGKSNTKPTTTNPPNTNTTNTNPANTTTTGPSNTGTIVEMFMTVWADGVKLPGESDRKDHLDKIEIVDYSMGVNTAREAGSGMSTGRVQYDPIMIKKFTGGAATIPYFKAFSKPQSLVVIIETYTTAQATGQTMLNYTIKLTGAKIAGFSQVRESISLGFFDIIKIVFQKIEFIKDGVSVESIL